ncbi:hypothetical protein DNTS_022872 [Danionella cerebrum]|uniref:Ig-like domain-containing protein n=1 Tax=Danionella cerebrum TaxID=2873325 RepID=A0A553QUX0_9TELE|nr:hypothetical protein DNTS_022872 [Danionella translucida]
MVSLVHSGDTQGISCSTFIASIGFVLVRLVGSAGDSRLSLGERQYVTRSDLWGFLWELHSERPLLDSKQDPCRTTPEQICSSSITWRGKRGRRVRKRRLMESRNSKGEDTGSAPPTAELKVTPDRVVFTGERVELKCEIQSDLSGWRYEWRRGNGVIQSSVQFSVNGDTLTIERVAESDQGKYRCWGTTTEGASLPSSSVFLSVKAPPELKVTPDRVVFTGERVKLKCEIQSDLSGWGYEWSRGNIYSVIQSSHRFSVNGDTLTIAKVAGSDEDAASSPVSLLVSPSRGQHFSFDSLSLSCDSSGWTVRRYTSSNPEDCPSQSGSSCVISSLQESDSGVYWCQSDSGEKRSPLNITVTQEDVILESPAGPVTEGETLTLLCSHRSRSSSILSAAFYKDGSLIQNQTTGEMSIAAVSESDEGFYSCRTEGGASPRSWISVRGAEGHFSLLKIITSLTTSSPFLLSTFVLLYKCHRARVASAADQRQFAVSNTTVSHHKKVQKSYFCFSTAPPFPELKVTPDRVVFTGERVQLKCKIQSDLRSWVYEWSRGNIYSVIRSSVRFSVNGDTLTIERVAESDQGKYRCWGTTTEGALFPSSSVFLSVKAPPSPELKVTPDRVVFTGERVELKCEIQSDLESWRYEWSRGNIYSVIRSSGGFSVDGNTLTIAAADVTDGGQYWCRVFITGRSVSSRSNSVSLSVHGLKPKPDLRSDSSTSLTGNTVTLTCSMAPITGWDFYWYKTSQSSEIKKIEKKNSYRFEIDSESTGGQFWCRAGRGKPVFYSEFSNLLQINVSVSPKTVVTVRPAERVFGGEEVSLRCDVEWGGDTEWIYSWRTEGTNQNKQFKTTVNKTSNQELNISRVDQSHSGKYFCTGHTGGHTGTQRSQSSEAVPLTVIPGEWRTSEILRSSSLKSLLWFCSGEARAALRVSPGPWLTEGDSVTLNCEVPDSSTGWRFSWFRDADLLSDSSRGAGGSYKLSPASLQHTGVYICRAQRGGAAYYTQNSSMELIWVSDAASSPVSLVVSPSRGQHFVFDSLSLSCDSSGWTVRRYTSSNPEDCPSQSGSSCVISSLQESDSGVYWCQSDSGEKRSPLNITVTQEDVILESPAGPVTEGETLTLLCSHRSRSSSILSAAFYKDGSLIQNQTTGEMSIAAVSESDEGFYSCRTEGGASPRSWISVRGAEGHFSLLKIITSLTTSSPFLLSTFVLLYKCHRARVASAAEQRQFAVEEE